ncbi:mycofactocin-coupled SDR family oxidoreductase [Rhodococcus sp. USK10]|uniref:3-oxoacyl-[acyl-carrier protein] reductase n=1 Tax=Rhodococcus wratislaviensis TaxID=44752 RepID=A0A402CF58_RHOWR|nr:MULTISPECIES: mycofactocin-coupled SDR family oxidoreductase [Rhodococcus]QYB07059.1 mycofactocin-coupled SDR family oxidoreductase [Rhodococcus sp. USK10]GCE42187.1 3-oxoacyl-[acyl-carrier protein] reductase [Rhodococcus wratislaviensis]
MSRVDGKVAFITGAARSQGRSHAVRLAEEGADIIAVDICQQIDTVPYPLSTEEDLAETARLVEKHGRRIVTVQADVRDADAMKKAVQAGLDEFGHIDIVSANAGIWSSNRTWELTQEQWDDMIGVNLTGVWQAIKAVVPSMIEAGNGGSIIITSSNGGVAGFENLAHYVAAKHGVVGLTRTLANELGRHNIRVNNIQPTAVNTNMIHHDGVYQLFFPGDPNPSREQFASAFQSLNSMPVPWVEPLDVSNAVLWLASDEARFVTGVSLPVDAGFLQKVGAS